jgi:hypothetical protein
MEIFSEEEVVNALSANRDALAQGMAHTEEFKKPTY